LTVIVIYIKRTNEAKKERKKSQKRTILTFKERYIITNIE